MNVDLPAPGAPLMPTRVAAPVAGRIVFQERDRVVTVIRARRLDERDRARQRPPVALAHRAGELSRLRHAAARRSRTNARISDAARQMLLPGPKIALTPASCRNS